MYRRDPIAIFTGEQLSKMGGFMNNLRSLIAFMIVSFAMLSLASIYAAAAELRPAKILGVDAHPEGRIVYWSNDRTPTYDGYPYFNISVQLGGDCYISRYDSQSGYYPADWKPGSTVQAHVGGGVIYLVRYDGAEVPTSIQTRCPTQD